MTLAIWRVFRSIAPYLLILLVGLFLWDKATRVDSPTSDPAVAVALEAKARELNAVKAQLVSEKALTATLHKDLQAFVDGMRKAAGVKKAPIGVLSETVTIADTAKGTPAPTPQEWAWQDEYHRFKVDFPSGLLERKQKFKIDIVAILIENEGLYTKLDFREFDPETGNEIPTTGIDHEGTLKVSTYRKGVKPFHPRLVAVADSNGGVGVGAELVNLKDKLNAGLVALYSGSEEEGRGGAFLGYRLFDSNVSLGAYGGISTKESGLVVGGLLTIGLTR